VANDPESNRHFGRLGQQIIVRESLQPPSPRRDDALTQAIELLEMATDDNRQFWQDILESCRLLTETPKQQITDTLAAPLGFIPSEPSLYARMQSTMGQYVHAQAMVARTKEADRYQEHLQELIDSQQGNLENVVTMAQTLQEDSKKLGSGVSQYIERLQNYLTSYQTAKKQGFFVNDRHHHSLQMALLRNRIRDVRGLQPKLQNIASSIEQAGRSFEALARNELDRLRNNYRFNEDDPDKMDRQLAAISYPHLVRDNYPVRFNKIASVEISPIAKQKETR